MFIVTVDHYRKATMIADVIERIDRNGEEMTKVPGFLFRHRTRHKDNHLHVGPITAWSDEAA